MSDPFTVGLPKWPALVVVGEDVTEDQALEIILRTDSYTKYPSSNEGRFDKAFTNMFGRPYDGYREDSDPVPGYATMEDPELVRLEKGRIRQAMWQADDQLFQDLKLLELSYLDNSQICSRYVGGPHGWCKWNGTIFTSDYNIGKWPSVEEVYDDWKVIAAAFPYLDLRSQLFNQEHCESPSSAIPAVEFVVKNGEVEVKEPDGVLSYPTEGSTASLLARLQGFGHEYVFEVEDLKEKYRQVYGEIPQWKCEEYDEWLKTRV